jgi:hypothetical protein
VIDNRNLNVLACSVLGELQTAMKKHTPSGVVGYVRAIPNRGKARVELIRLEKNLKRVNELFVVCPPICLRSSQLGSRQFSTAL